MEKQFLHLASIGAEKFNFLEKEKTPTARGRDASKSHIRYRVLPGERQREILMKNPPIDSPG